MKTDDTYDNESLHTPESRERDAALADHEAMTPEETRSRLSANAARANRMTLDEYEAQQKQDRRRPRMTEYMESPAAEIIALAAWCNVHPTQLPPDMRAPDCEGTMQGWARVATALIEYAYAGGCKCPRADLSTTPPATVREAARLLANLPMRQLIEATELSLHEMGEPRPRDSKNHHRTYFLGVCRAFAEQEDV